jgi:hypothetical protein
MNGTQIFLLVVIAILLLILIVVGIRTANRSRELDNQIKSFYDGGHKKNNKRDHTRKR